MQTKSEDTMPGEQDIEAFVETSQGASHVTMEDSSLIPCVDDFFQDFISGDRGLDCVEAAPRYRATES
jgi:hypothetical protein